MPTSNINEQKPLIFDASFLQNQSSIPQEFIWPDEEKPCIEPPPLLHVPYIDLNGFFSGDPILVSNTIELVKQACLKHGFFLVINHGIDSQLVKFAHQRMDFFFEKPLFEKLRAKRKVDDHCGYASSFTNRFSSKLPWKETLSFRYCDDVHTSNIVESYFLNVMGEDFRQFGYVNSSYYISHVRLIYKLSTNLMT